MRQFADEAGVSAWTLYTWKRRLRESRSASAPSDPELVAVEIVGGRKSIRAGTGEYEIALANGARLRVPRDFDAARVSSADMERPDSSDLFTCSQRRRR